MKNPLNAAIENWEAHGGKIYEFIDPVDSTHPTQVFYFMVYVKLVIKLYLF